MDSMKVKESKLDNNITWISCCIWHACLGNVGLTTLQHLWGLQLSWLAVSIRWPLWSRHSASISKAHANMGVKLRNLSCNRWVVLIRLKSAAFGLPISSYHNGVMRVWNCTSHLLSLGVRRTRHRVKATFGWYLHNSQVKAQKPRHSVHQFAQESLVEERVFERTGRVQQR